MTSLVLNVDYLGNNTRLELTHNNSVMKRNHNLNAQP